MTTTKGAGLRKIRIGKHWLASLVCRPGGAVLTDDETQAGTFSGPYSTAHEARRILGYEPRVWLQPVDGSPGEWTF